MRSKIVLSLAVMGLCAPCCLAQISKPSAVIAPPRTAPLDIYPWVLPPTGGLSGPTLFPGAAPQAWDPQNIGWLNISWSLAEIAAQLYNIHAGMPFALAVQQIRILGGVEEGGLQRESGVQTFPATRYFFAPGIIVNIPEKGGYVTGPPEITRGQLAFD